MRKFGNFILGLISGAMVGGLLALLLAPSTGEDTRGKILDYADRINREVQTAAQEKRAALEAELASLRSPQKEQS